MKENQENLTNSMSEEQKIEMIVDEKMKEIETVKKVKKNKSLVFLILFLTLGLGLAAAYFGYSYFQLKDKVEMKDQKENKQVDLSQNKEKDRKEIKEKETVSEELEGFETIDVDEDWNLYRNYDLRFEIKVPKRAMSYEGGCEWVENESDHSYRPRIMATPVKVTEKENGIFIDFEYRYELGGESNEDGRSFFSECNRKENNLAYLNAERRTWNIIVEDVENENDLEEFIQDRFGSGCSLGAQEETDQEGVMQVKVEGDGLDLGETNCPINYMFKLYYVPNLAKTYTWDQGQAYKFMISENGYESYDEGMEESFRISID